MLLCRLISYHHGNFEMAFSNMSFVSTFSFQVRGFLLNFGVYHATRAALGLSFQWRLVIICTTFDK